MKQGWIVL